MDIRASAHLIILVLLNFPQIEDPPHQFDDRSRLGFLGGRLQRRDRRVHDLIDDATRESLNGQLLLGR